MPEEHIETLYGDLWEFLEKLPKYYRARIGNMLYHADIRSLKDLKETTYWYLQSIPNFGEKCLTQTKEALGKLDPPVHLKDKWW